MIPAPTDLRSPMPDSSSCHVYPMSSLLTGDVGIAVLSYVIASSAAVAADIDLDQDRMDWIRRVFTYWFAFELVTCAAACIARPLTDREAMGLIFYLNNFMFRSAGFLIIVTQTIKVTSLYESSSLGICSATN